MPPTTTKLTTAVEDYFSDLRRVRASGGATGERSYYPALTNLLNAVGGALKPQVFCVSELSDHGVGHPDLGLYAKRQVQKGTPRPGQIPERGVVEVKPDGDTLGAADELKASAARGRELAALLDSETPVPGVTTGALRPEIASIAVPTTADGGNMAADDFSMTAGWGHFGQGEAVMPGQGRIVERPYTSEERAAQGSSADALGDATFDIHLNDRAYWRNVPAAVWGYKLGGYQVLKKWLSYRERGVLGRALKPEEVQHFTDTARRIAGILGLVGEG